MKEGIIHYTRIIEQEFFSNDKKRYVLLDQEPRRMPGSTTTFPNREEVVYNLEYKMPEFLLQAFQIASDFLEYSSLGPVGRKCFLQRHPELRDPLIKEIIKSYFKLTP